MKSLSLTSTAWFSYRGRCLSLVEKILLDPDPHRHSIVVDMNTIRREPDIAPGESLLVFKEVDFREWITETLTEGGVVNVEVVRRAATEMQEGEVIIINATGFVSGTIDRGLYQLRLGLFSHSAWPSGIILICDDAQLYQAGPALAHAFVIRPNLVSKAVVDKMVRSKMWQANMLRIFGRGVAYAPVMVQRFISWWVTRRENKISKEYGWVWEE